MVDNEEFQERMIENLETLQTFLKTWKFGETYVRYIPRDSFLKTARLFNGVPNIEIMDMFEQYQKSFIMNSNELYYLDKDDFTKVARQLTRMLTWN